MREIQPTYMRLPAELHAAVKARAKEEERSMAGLIRVAIRYYLQNTDPLGRPVSDNSWQEEK